MANGRWPESRSRDITFLQYKVFQGHDYNKNEELGLEIQSTTGRIILRRKTRFSLKLK
jgi:hypothetical protein